VTTPYIDWAVAAYFYAALHWVDAILWEQENINPSDHHDRREYVKAKSYLRGIKDEYRNLFDRSIEARYDCLTFTSVKVEQRVIPLYEAIEHYIVQRLPDQDSGGTVVRQR
jgi:hypothetical protein